MPKEQIVTKDYEGKDDRRGPCRNCVKDDFAGLVRAVNELASKVSKIIGASGWQKTIIIMLLAGGLAGSTGSLYVVIAKANTDAGQNTEIALIKHDVKSNTESVKELTTNVNRLVIAQEKLVTIMEEREKKGNKEEESE